MLTITADTLATLDAFSKLDRVSREQVITVCSARTYPRSSVVIAHREQTANVFFIVSGSVRATAFTERGREIAYEDLFAGDMFGELSAIDGKPRTTHVVTLEESTLITVMQEQFLGLMKTYPEVTRATLKKVAGVIRFLCDRVYEFGALDVNSRIRTELLRLAAGDIDDPNRATIPKMPTHQDLANRLATHREAVSRELSRLEKDGLTQKQGQSLVINDIEALSNMINDARSAQS
ncbi:MAG: Crp/Fnr family transcriptional regulator [Gammaproteobacteria bacterium]|nr:Crp/Fnr family transcriptional regulator [Gammaproteobacteria bacterium]